MYRDVLRTFTFVGTSGDNTRRRRWFCISQLRCGHSQPYRDARFKMIAFPFSWNPTFSAHLEVSTFDGCRTRLTYMVKARSAWTALRYILGACFPLCYTQQPSYVSLAHVTCIDTHFCCEANLSGNTLRCEAVRIEHHYLFGINSSLQTGKRDFRIIPRRHRRLEQSIKSRYVALFSQVAAIWSSLSCSGAGSLHDVHIRRHNMARFFVMWHALYPVFSGILPLTLPSLPCTFDAGSEAITSDLNITKRSEPEHRECLLAFLLRRLSKTSRHPSQSDMERTHYSDSMHLWSKEASEYIF